MSISKVGIGIATPVALEVPEAIVTASAQLPTYYGEFELATFHVEGADRVVETPHLLLSMGLSDGGSDATPLVRIHSECFTGDVFRSSRCDCGKQLDYALEAISARGHGAVVYLRQEGRGVGLVNKVKAYALQDHEGLDTVDANVALGLPVDAREYSAAAAILLKEQADTIDLLTNNPEKVRGIESFGITVRSRRPVVRSARHGGSYLRTKAERMGHILSDE